MSIGLAIGSLIVLAFLALCAFLLYMVLTIIRDGWSTVFGAFSRTRPILAQPGVWPPPEPGYTYWGQTYLRIPYGEEHGVLGAKNTICPSCEAGAGQYHVRGCVVEECPVCGECASNCDCKSERFQELSLFKGHN